MSAAHFLSYHLGFWLKHVGGGSAIRGRLRVQRGGEIFLVFGLVLPVLAASDIFPSPEVHKHSHSGILF